MWISAKTIRQDNLCGYSGSPGVFSSDPPKVTSGSRITCPQCRHSFSLDMLLLGMRLAQIMNTQEGQKRLVVLLQLYKETEARRLSWSRLIAMNMYMTVLWC